MQCNAIHYNVTYILLQYYTLHCALRCAALRCAALRCAALRCAALRCAALRCAALRCAALRCAALRCAALPCPALPCPTLPYPTLPYPACTICRPALQPPAKQPPSLDVNRVPDSLESLGGGRYGYVLNERWLKASHAEVGPDDLLYTLIDRPRNGYLEHTVRQRVIRRRFTQRDVEDRKVVYVLNDKTQATNDSFTFRLQDRHSNTLDNQRCVVVNKI